MLFQRKQKCKYCGNIKRIPKARFCPECGGKYGTNYDCGYRKKPHNCGRMECPRYRLFLMDVARDPAKYGLGCSRIL